MISILKAMIPPDTKVEFYTFNPKDGTHKNVTDFILGTLSIGVTINGTEKILPLSEVLKDFIGEDSNGA